MQHLKHSKSSTKLPLHTLYLSEELRSLEIMACIKVSNCDEAFDICSFAFLQRIGITLVLTVFKLEVRELMKDVDSFWFTLFGYLMPLGI